MEQTPHHYTYNFNAGPAKLPPEVLLQAQRELIYFGDSGISVLEMNNSNPELIEIIRETECLLRELLSIPDNYRVLFMHGGAFGQFAALPLNLAKRGDIANYVITGTWSEIAAKEAEKYISIKRIAPARIDELRRPDITRWSIAPDARYLFYTDNETIDGVEFGSPILAADLPPTMPIVFDATSSFLSRPIDVSNYGAIIAATQKNAGIAGLVISIVRDDLIEKNREPTSSICPTILDYSAAVAALDTGLLPNTPPTFPIYICGLYLRWIKREGGLREMARRADERARLVYDAIDRSDGFYRCSADCAIRSRMNAVFRICCASTGDPDPQLESRFVDEAASRSFVGVKGHRRIGGIRISMFNACPIEDAKVIAAFMDDFRRRITKSDKN